MGFGIIANEWIIKKKTNIYLLFMVIFDIKKNIFIIIHSFQYRYPL